MKRSGRFAIYLCLCAVIQVGKSEEINGSDGNINRQQQVVHNESNMFSEVTYDVRLRRTASMDISYSETSTESYITSGDLRNTGDQKQSSVINISNQGAQNNEASTISTERVRNTTIERYYIKLYENGSHVVLDDDPELMEEFNFELRNNESYSVILSRNVSDITISGHLAVTDDYVNDTAANATTEFDLQTLTYEEGLYTSLQPLSELHSQFVVAEYVNESTNSSFDKKQNCDNETECKLNETKRDLIINTFNVSFTEDSYNSILNSTSTTPYANSDKNNSIIEIDISYNQNSLEIERHVTTIPELLSSINSIYVPNNSAEQFDSTLNAKIQNLSEGTTNVVNFEQSAQPNTEITNDYSLVSNSTEENFIGSKAISSTTEEVGNGSFSSRTSDETDTKMLKHEATHLNISEITTESYFASDIVTSSGLSEERSLVNYRDLSTISNETNEDMHSVSATTLSATTLSNNGNGQNVHLPRTSSFATLNQSLIISAITERTQKEENTGVPIEREQPTTEKSNIEIFGISLPQLIISSEGTAVTTIANDMFSLTNQQVNITNTYDKSSTSNTFPVIETQHSLEMSVSRDASLSISMPHTISLPSTTESSVGSFFSFGILDKNYSIFTTSQVEISEATKLQSQFSQPPEASFHSNISQSSKVELPPYGATQTESSPIVTTVYKPTDSPRNATMPDELEATELLTLKPMNVTFLSPETTTTPPRLTEGPLTTDNTKIITPQFISRSDQEAESKSIFASSEHPPTVLNPTVLYNGETFQTISNEFDTRISTEGSALSSGATTLLKTTMSTFVRNTSTKTQATNETVSVLEDQHHTKLDDRDIYEVTNNSTHSVATTTTKIFTTKFSDSENTSIYVTQQKTLFFQREIGNISEEEMNNVVTVVFHLPQAHQNEDLFVLYVARFNDWLVQTVKENMEQEAIDPHSNVTTVFQKGKNTNNNFVEVIYILPSPNLQGEDVIFTFFCRSIQTTAIIPFMNILHFLSSDVDELNRKLNLNLRYFARGLYPSSDETDEWTTLDEVWKKYGTLLITVGLFTLLILTILAAAIMYLRCKAKQSGHYLSETDKLQCNLQVSLEVGDMTSASIILQNEIFEKDSTVNGNHICVINDDEGWLVPLGDVPVEDTNAPEVQDTKL